MVECASIGVLDDEIHNRLPIPWRERIVSFAFLDDDRDLSAQFLEAFFDNECLVLQPRIKMPQTCRSGTPALASGARFSSRGFFDIWLRSTGFSA